MSETWYWAQRWSNFRRGTRQLRLRWSDGTATVTLYEEGARETVAAVIRRLPLEVPVVHVAWSGDMVMSTHPYDLGVAGAENEVRLVRPGDLSWDSKFGEIAFTYDTAECRLPSGPNTVTVFGEVTQGLGGFANYCAARRFEGMGTICLESLPTDL